MGFFIHFCCDRNLDIDSKFKHYVWWENKKKQQQQQQNHIYGPHKAHVVLLKKENIRRILEFFFLYVFKL